MHEVRSYIDNKNNDCMNYVTVPSVVISLNQVAFAVTQ